VAEGNRVVFKLGGTREHTLSIDDANDVLSYLRGRDFAVSALHRQVRLAVEQRGGEVRVDEDARQQLLLVFEAMDGLSRPLTEHQRALRGALRDPILLHEGVDDPGDASD
jgi:hypothetical protein